jgi:hypothetical protein
MAIAQGASPPGIRTAISLSLSWGVLFAIAPATVTPRISAASGHRWQISRATHFDLISAKIRPARRARPKWRNQANVELAFNQDSSVKTDSIFFKIFQELPGVLFELLGEPFDFGGRYEFQSIEVKQTAFRIDGVFVPKPEAPDQTVYFVEVQYQSDEFLYDRMFAEIGMYLAQNPKAVDWQAIAIFPRRSLEPRNQHRHRSFLQGDQFRTIFLEDLLDIPTVLIGIQLMQLIAAKPKTTQGYLNQLASQL